MAAHACAARVTAARLKHSYATAGILYPCSVSCFAAVVPACSELNAARSCVDSASAEGSKDPYMLLTHANVVMAALPPYVHTRKEATDKQRKEYIYKVR